VTTVDSRDAAAGIADALVRERLAGCVQVAGPISSTYWWNGAVESAEEWLCLIKTRQALFPEVEAAIRAVHPYDVPEILAIPVVAGGRDYLGWLASELRTERQHSPESGAGEAR
jgi:periplasmic divalent cation tolerance protein